MSHDGPAAALAERLDAELAQLRERLRGVSARDIEATALPAALRARRARGTAPSAPAACAQAAVRERAPLVAAAAAPPHRAPLFAATATRRPRAVLAAAAALAMAAVAALLALRTGPPLAESGGRPPAGEPRPARTAAAPTAAAPTAAFQPLLYAPGFSPTGSYSVVRVRIPLSAIAQGPRLEGTIEADLLVGEDGLASGIRFASTDTQLVSAGSR